LNISEEKLLEFIEGYLDEEESKQIIQSIGNDKELEEQYKLLLEGKQLLDEWHKNEVANAPDANKAIIMPGVKIKEKIFNFWNFVPQLNIGGLVGAASFALIAFIGGNELSIVKERNEIDLNNRQIAFMENDNIKMRNNSEIIQDWTKEEWHINNNIAVSLVTYINGNKIFLNPNDKVTPDQSIQIRIQVFEESLVTIQVKNNTGIGILFNYEDINIKPNDIFVTKKFRLKNNNEIKKIIINSKSDEKISKNEFILN
jgi:hypothetical protein